MKKIFVVVIAFIMGNQMFAQAGCIQGNCEKGNGTYRWDNGDTYTGKIKKNMKIKIKSYKNSHYDCSRQH